MKHIYGINKNIIILIIILLIISLLFQYYFTYHKNELKIYISKFNDSINTDVLFTEFKDIYFDNISINFNLRKYDS